MTERTIDIRLPVHVGHEEGEASADCVACQLRRRLELPTNAPDADVVGGLASHTPPGRCFEVMNRAMRLYPRHVHVADFREIFVDGRRGSPDGITPAHLTIAVEDRILKAVRGDEARAEFLAFIVVVPSEAAERDTRPVLVAPNGRALPRTPRR